MSQYSPGDWVVFAKQKWSASPGPRARWTSSRPWTRTCRPVHLILAHLLRHENHQDGRPVGRNQDKARLSCPKPQNP